MRNFLYGLLFGIVVTPAAYFTAQFFLPETKDIGPAPGIEKSQLIWSSFFDIEGLWAWPLTHNAPVSKAKFSLIKDVSVTSFETKDFSKICFSSAERWTQARPSHLSLSVTLTPEKRQELLQAFAAEQAPVKFGILVGNDVVARFSFATENAATYRAALEANDPAPDFTLTAQEDEIVYLVGYAGYVAGDTPVAACDPSVDLSYFQGFFKTSGKLGE